MKKLTGIILCFGLLQVAVSGFAQGSDANESMRNVPLEDLLAAIDSRTLADNMVVASAEIKSPARQFVVSGKVVDIATGDPLPGVNVVEEGTTNGTVTNLEGIYSLDVSDGDAVLLFSYVGYVTQRIPVAGVSTINVELVVDVAQLEEVVVIGYGTVRKSDLTGAVASVSEESLKQSVSTSLDQALQGRAAGVQVYQNSGQPGGGVSIRIRGASSINGNNEPLYVIDGIPISGDAGGTAIGFDWGGGGNGQTAVSALSNINPADIVSVEILKDASATAIYGSRGANGVVLITTRRGKSGQAKVSYEGYYGSQTVSKYMDIMNLREYADYMNDLAEEGLITQREQFLDPSLLGEGTDWQREIYRTAPMRSHQLTVSGGNDKTRYSISGGYYDQEGIIIGSNFDRMSLRLNLDNQSRDWLMVGNSFMVSRTNERITLNDSDDGIVTSALLQAPDIPVRYPDGSWGGPYESEFGVDNPVAKALDRDLRLIRTRMLGSIYAELTFLNDFKFRTELGGDFNVRNNYGFKPTWEYGSRINTLNESRRQFHQGYFWIFKNYLTYSKSFGIHNIVAMAGYEAQESAWEGLEGKRTNFASDDIQELNAGDPTTATNSGYKASNALISYFGRVNYSLFDRYLITATIRADGSSKFGPDNKWGYFPSFALAWKISNESFMQNLSGINDLKLRIGYGLVGNQDFPSGYAYGSSLRTVASGVGSGYLLNNHPNPALKWESTVQYNLGLDIGVFENRIQLTADLYSKQTQDMLIQLPLPNYMGGGSWMGVGEPWVNLGELENKGIELALNTRNIVGTGFTWNSNFIFSKNKNKIISLGQEDAVISKNVQWFYPVTRTEEGYEMGQFYGYSVVGIFTSADQIYNSPKQSDKIHPTEGVWLGDLQFENIFKGDSADYQYSPTDAVTEVINEKDRKFLGSPHPKFTFGFNNTFGYKGFDMTLYLQGVYGNKIYNFTRGSTEGMRASYANQLKTVNDRARLEMIDEEGDNLDPYNWRVTNPDTEVPRGINTDPNDNTRVSDRFIEDGSYLRIKNWSLGYTIPLNITSRFKISRLRVYTNIQNLYTFTKYSGYDPEIGAYDQDPLLQGVDNGRYPLPRIYTFGVTLEF